jgi:hypothetical protein
VDPTHQGLLVGAVQDTRNTDTETYATRVSIVYAVRTIKLLLNDTHVKSISARPVTRNPFVLNHVDYILPFRPPRITNEWNKIRSWR